MGCCTFGIFGGPCFLVHVPFGIWGLVMLSNSEVKEAFR
jgi:hypothetical protein